MPTFGRDFLGNADDSEQIAQQVQAVDPAEGDERTGISNNHGALPFWWQFGRKFGSEIRVVPIHGVDAPTTAI